MATERRLIDADALKSEFEWLKSVVNESSKDEVQDAIQRIENAPAVDVVEVVRGRCWLCEDYDRFVEVVCYLPNDNGAATSIPLNYCPNCGAKMDGDGNG